jgi:hypothetical protein
MYRRLSKFLHERWAMLFPEWYVRYLYKKNLNQNLNLKNPKDYREKLQWLKLYSDISQWTDLADKYKVRDYVTQCGLGDLLPELYGVWERAEDIDFDTLPDKFVLKTNHGYKRLIIVKDKSKLDIEKTRKQFNHWVSERYGMITYEPHYWNIDRRIIAEELLEDEYNASFSTSVIDYKIFCFHGEPFILGALYNRKNSVVGEESIEDGPEVRDCGFDMDWTYRPEISTFGVDPDAPAPLPKPGQLEDMEKFCRILSKPFPHVRVDFYEVHNKVYFGEMTFTPGGGLNFFTDEFFMEMGEQLDLSRVKRKGEA